MRTVLVAALLAAAVVAGTAAAAAPAAAAPGAQLRVTVWSQGQPGPARTWTLTCAPTGGTHPARGRACQTLSRLLPQPFRPVPRDMMCIQIYGGPDEALVTGRLNGARVWARFNLRDGCQIARWTRLAPLLPSAGAS